jgi:hypothetical protein
MKPFATKELNLLETYSLITSVITIYCGLFFVSADNPEGCKDFFILTFYSTICRDGSVFFLLYNNNSECTFLHLLGLQNVSTNKITFSEIQ